MSLNNVDTTEVAKIASGNKMCGFILSGLNSNSTEDNQDDASKGGNCDFFSPQCRQDLQSAALDSATDCGSPTIPDSCNDWLGLSPSGDGVLQMVTFDFTEKLLTGSRFFTFGSAPASENDETEYDTAIRNIWPVVFTWSHTSGTPPDNTTKGASTLRCLRPNNIASGSRDPNAPKKGGNGDDGDKGNGDHPGAASINSMPSLGAMLLLTASASWFMLL
ncbi:uncharacterized protein TrAtP1_012995 [Trichoderma atroviride]|nr:hypothetical protein TrAtP1_012995 [Trichoderma atroviride]